MDSNIWKEIKQTILVNEPIDEHLRGPYSHGFSDASGQARPYIMCVTGGKHLHAENTVTAGVPTGGGPFWPATTPEANARRIAACLNACDGVSTAQLEANAGDQPYWKLLKDRDYLLDRVAELELLINRMKEAL